MSDERKLNGTDDEKSECLHSSDEDGEPTQGTRQSEGGHRDTEPVEGNQAVQQRPAGWSTGLDWVARLARERPGEALTTLSHHITLELLHQAFRATRKDGAVGVDGVTAAEYERSLDENLSDLLRRFKTSTYRAPPVRRVHIPKGDGSKKRPIGIPTLEDKVLQRAVAMVLEAIYEQDFRDCSYGFRPKRGAHQALDALGGALYRMKDSFVIEVDIKGFFDNLDHAHLRTFLDSRVRDGTIRRMIDKWLKAGVLEDGSLSRPSKGTPQGGVISPLLANIYLHHVLDTWFEDEVRPRLKGTSALVRYADDFVIALEHEDDARRVMAVLPNRFGRYGLELHPDKTRLVRFKRPSDDSDDDGTGGGRSSFDLLGFTFFWGKSRRGQWIVRRKTAKSSLKKSLLALKTWMRSHRHWRLREQHAALCRKLRGHYAYFGIVGNAASLSIFLMQAERLWRNWLDRRSQRRCMPWTRFTRVLDVYSLPSIRIVHPWRPRVASP